MGERVETLEKQVKQLTIILNYVVDALNSNEIYIKSAVPSLDSLSEEAELPSIPDNSEEE